MSRSYSPRGSSNADFQLHYGRSNIHHHHHHHHFYNNAAIQFLCRQLQNLNSYYKSWNMSAFIQQCRHNTGQSPVTDELLINKNISEWEPRQPGNKNRNCVGLEVRQHGNHCNAAVARASLTRWVRQMPHWQVCTLLNSSRARFQQDKQKLCLTINHPSPLIQHSAASAASIQMIGTVTDTHTHIVTFTHPGRLSSSSGNGLM